MSWQESNAENDDGADGNQEDEGEEEFRNSIDRIIFLVDAREEMFQLNAHGEPQLINCLKVALEVMKTKVIAQDASSLGIAFFGSREKDSADGAEGVFTFQSLAPPSAARIRQLLTLIEDVSSFKRMIGSQGAEKRSVPLKQALWTCSQAFGTKDSKRSDFKRIWLFTNDDNPNAAFPIEQKATMTVAKDCAQAGVEISLWHLQRGAEPFNPRLYYVPLLASATIDSESSQVEEESEEMVSARMLGAGLDGFDSLVTSVRRKAYRQRRIGSTLFSLDPINTLEVTQHMAVQVFKEVHVAKKPQYVILSAATHTPLQTVTRYYDEATGEVLESKELETFVEAGGCAVRLLSEEVDSLRAIGNVPGVGIRLVAFLPKACLPPHLRLDGSYLLYPNEKAVQGSAALFEALLRSCASREVLPLVRFNRVDRAMARMAALLPQLEEVDEDGCQLRPPAFHILQLPFLEDLRFCPLPSNTTQEGENDNGDEVDHIPHFLPEEIHKNARDLVQKLGQVWPEDFRYDRDFENPALQQFYAVLQAVALNSEDLEWQAARDDMLRPSAAMSDQCTSLATSLRLSTGLPEPGSEPEKAAKAPAKKRAATGEASTSGTTKRAKADQRKETDFSEENIQRWAAAGELLSFTLAQLKDMCRTLGIPISGTKADLASRITAQC
eukprot:gene4691-5138_t